MANFAFTQIAGNTKVPGVFVETSNVAAGTNQTNLVALIIGQTIVSSVTQTPQLVQSAAQAVTNYGAGSQLSLMVNAFLAENPFTTLYACPLNATTPTSEGVE
jgi:phage tail sheath gpL-like